MKYILITVLMASFPSCAVYPWSHVGGCVVNMEVENTNNQTPNIFVVTLQKNELDMAEEHLHNVLKLLGLDFVDKGKIIIFKCSRAELIGFLAAISSDGRVEVDIMNASIHLKEPGFTIVCDVMQINN